MQQNKSKYPSQLPYMLVGNAEGEISEHTGFKVSGRTGLLNEVLDRKDFIELPEGSDLFILPGRKPVGMNVDTGMIENLDTGFAVGAFVAPAHTQYYFPSYKKEPEAPVLPLFAYSAVGWLNGKFYVVAVRIDGDFRQDCEHFDQNQIIQNAEYELQKNTENRLLKHISHCALTYFCPAARNYFMYRWEAPLPTSPTCNSRCLGCISYQPKDTDIQSPQNRITFVPTPEEIAEIAVPHLKKAPMPVVSYGQGCEGEPLNVWEVLRDSILLIRQATSKGIINLNTNGSKPDAVEALCKAGIDSFRISLNSAIEEYYNSYYRPVNYNFEDVIQSIKIARKYNKWVSINYFVFPGVTDSLKEYEALCKLIDEIGINMIQWRNFNIDPDWYLEAIEFNQNQPAMGVKKLIKSIKKQFPKLYHGYFNPHEKIIKEYI